jgi:hypothetical protein
MHTLTVASEDPTPASVRQAVAGHGVAARVIARADRSPASLSDVPIAT